MKKKLFAILLAFVLMAAVLPGAAATDLVPFSTMVWDGAGLLEPSEAEELDLRAWEITHTYGCAVYIVTLPSLDGWEAWEVAEFLQEEYAMGYGDDQSCVILLLSEQDRTYDIMARGYGNTAFTDNGKVVLAERFLGALGEDDWYTGFQLYLEGCDEFLKAAREGEPVNSEVSPVWGIVFSAGLSSLVALIVCSIFKAQMKTARMQTTARGYINEQGLVLAEKEDQFLHTTRTQRKIESNNSGGTTVNSRGNSHSGGSF